LDISDLDICHPVVETFSDAQEGAKHVAELKQMQDREIQHMVVDGLKSK
jgi:hypothetical protein